MPATSAKVEQLPVDVRPMVEADQAFIFATWLNHSKGSSRYGRALDRDGFFKSFHRTIEAVLARKECRVLVATPHGGEEIVGYLITDTIAEKPAVHFAFVKKFARKSEGVGGVLRALWAASAIDGNDCIWTCPTDAETWVKKRFPKIEVLDLFR